MNYILMSIIWFVCGFIVAIPVISILIATRGDSGVNEQIADIRKMRIKIAQKKLELQIRKFLIFGHKQGYVIKIGNQTIEGKK